MADQRIGGGYRLIGLHRVRQNTRIRPVRPYWSRTKLLRVASLALVVVGLMGTAWLQRTTRIVVPLDPSGPYRITSTVGPIEVTSGASASFRYDASWLLRGPSVVDGSTTSTDLELRCDTAWPCRAPSVVELPTVGAAVSLQVSSVDQDLLISQFAGALTARTHGDGDVVLGPIGGTVSARADRGAVFGYGLTASEIDVQATDGPVELHFAAIPRTVSVRSGHEPVIITLPPGDYAVSVEGESSIAINVGQASDAENKITINARGPVRIDPAR